MTPIATLIFDLDGTLYEDERVYDRYARELGRFLPPDRQQRYLAAWSAAKAGQGPARVGLGYDEAQDRLFRFRSGRIHSFLDWEGREEVVTEDERPSACNSDRAAPGYPSRTGLSGPQPGGRRGRRGTAARPRPTGTQDTVAYPPIETEIFGSGRLYIGDWWGLPDVLAAHYGVAPSDRATAFLATREYMSGPDFRLQAEPWLIALLAELRAQGRRLVALSNSPSPSVEDVLARLGIHDQFDLIVSSAAKPAGLARFLQENGAPDRILSVGDHYVNDIAPALQAGGHALYIDRHATGLGDGLPRCRRSPSRQSLPVWLRRLGPGIS